MRFCFGVIRRRIRRALRGLLPSTEAHIPVTLQLNQQWFGSGLWRSIRRARGLDDDNLRRRGRDRQRFNGIVRIKGVTEENRAGGRRSGNEDAR